MGNHTPGPWFVDENNDIWRRDPKELYENGGGVAGDKPLACCYKGWFGEGQTGYPAAANAQLISAAPDLLAALKKALEALERADDYGVPGLGRVIDAADDAIRKADGEGE
ncbi:hypothetical protein SDC9_142774 [bioreactor metagenome]|uniref:Uncharacterized protein n=1 Tax=bioreactor metagenome TaxID=1076179 RepID=A0A645E244_9ZZZZ